MGGPTEGRDERKKGRKEKGTKGRRDEDYFGNPPQFLGKYLEDTRHPFLATRKGGKDGHEFKKKCELFHTGIIPKAGHFSI